MPTLVACAEPGFEPIEGYVLREKLGAGGYGEVWLADAPGGLQKAIKFVFGTINGEHAAGELKALQRVCQANHPFILSLERIEIIEDQLIIVTELADGSLYDRLCEYRRKGEIGIPRERLLEYMRDAADALDFLCQKHDLQHLDVKPGNLLLVADRVKVADFGLIKDVQSSSMSMLNGLTPTYAAPEMFDGRPGRFSDQYSLAIVYQELLTGTVPFQGRTAAQLASEHLHKAPNLESLPACDRPILAKALSKKPDQRYASCKEMIRNLMSAEAVERNTKTATAPSFSTKTETGPRRTPSYNPPTPPADDSTNGMEDLSRNTNNLSSGELVELPVLPNSIAKADKTPVLFIGVGGTGAEMLNVLRHQLAEQGMEPDQPTREWLIIDTDSSTLETALQENSSSTLPVDAICIAPLKSAAYYRDQDANRFSPVSRRWLYNIPRSGKTEGVRPLAMLSLLDHAQQISHYLDRSLSQLSAAIEADKSQAEPQPLRVYIVGSAHGGTGSALVGEIGFLVRRVLDNRDWSAQIQALITVAKDENRSNSQLAACSALACVTELNSYQRTNGLHPGWPGLPPSLGVPRPPVDYLYLIDGGVLGHLGGWDAAIHHAARYLMLDGCLGLRQLFDGIKDEAAVKFENDRHVSWTPTVRTFAANSLEYYSELDATQIAALATWQSLYRWQARLANMDRPAPAPNRASEANVAQLKKVTDQLDAIATDLFRQNRWSAQDWVQRVQSQLSNSGAASDGKELDRTGDSHEALFDDPALQELSHQLRVDLASVRESVEPLVRDTMDSLRRWLTDAWLKSRASWGHLAPLLRIISEKFQEQAKAIVIVADRLARECDARIGRSAAASVGVASNVGEKNAPHSSHVAVEQLLFHEKLHRVAGKMLLRVSEYVLHLRQNWIDRSRALRLELQNWGSEMAEAIPIASADNQSPTFGSIPLPRLWESVRIKTLESAENHIERLAKQSLSVAWNVPQLAADGDAVEPHDELASFMAEILRIACQHATEAGLKCDADLATLQAVSREATQSVSEVASADRPAADTTSESEVERDASADIITHVARTTRQSRNWSGNGRIRITEQTANAFAPLLRWGGAKRMVLALPDAGYTAEIERRWRELIPSAVSVVRVPQLDSPMLICEGEQLSLSDLAQHLWMPAQEQWQLATRLHSRTDVEWLMP